MGVRIQVDFKVIKSGIARRWFSNVFVIIFLLICTLVVIAFAGIRSYYITSATQTLDSKAEVDSSYFSEFYTTQSDMMTGVRQYVESYPDRNKIELMVANTTGRVILTSSGFTPDNKYPDDINKAISEGKSEYTGENEYGENIIAISRSVELNGQVVCVLRYVISTHTINMRILAVLMVIIGFGIILMIVSILSGRYFINSIIKPLATITDTAKTIAKNDFSVRIDEKYRDEIGELAHEINNMAEALGASETMKNDFTSSISHELLTPLTAIRGWSETLSDPAMRTDEVVDKGVKVITAESNRLSAMVEELLDYSRMQSGRMSVNMTKLDLIAELEETVMMFEERAKKANISLQVTAPETCSPILGDSARIKQVFVNIIDNAIKYSNPEGGTVEINLFENKNKITVVIADNGVGITPEDLPRVKQKFYKGNSARPGSGIGLAIVDEIMKLHGGEFEIDSVFEKGTTVLVSFPIMQLPDTNANN